MPYLIKILYHTRGIEFDDKGTQSAVTNRFIAFISVLINFAMMVFLITL